MSLINEKEADGQSGTLNRNRVQDVGFAHSWRPKIILLQLVTLAFAILFQIPGWHGIWEGIYGYPMVDRSVYETQILIRNLTIDYLPDFDLVSYFTFEFLWGTSLAYLSRDVGLSPDQIFALLTTFIIWRFAFMISTSVGWLYVPILLNPLIVDLAFSQLRLAAAIAIISFVWKWRKNSIFKILVYVVATAVHTAIILFAIMHLAAHFFQERKFRNLLALVFLGFSIAVAIGPAREIILGAVGDRRIDYNDMSSSIAYLSFWILLWGLLLVQWRSTIATFDGRYALIILSIVAANVIFQGYSTRFIAAAFPSIVAAMAAWRSTPFSLPVALFLPYSFLQWLYWLKLV